MRTLLVGAGLALALAAPASAATGPFLGTVAQGETDSYTYDNNPSNQNCIQLAANYTVALRHVSAGDTLTLSVGNQSATTTGGSAALTVESGVCARFGVSVTGTSVSGSANYVVTVTRQLLPPLS